MNNSLDRYFKDISKYPLLPAKEERVLCEQLEDDNFSKNARDKLVLSNLKLVAKIASDYQGRGVDIEDLITEGNIGLMVSAKKFNPKFKNKFCTYASYWIKHHINRSIELKGKTIRMQTHAIASAAKIFKFKDTYKDEYGEEPSIEEICKSVKVKKKTARNILEISGGTVNLDSTMRESTNTFSEIIPSEENTPFENVLSSSDTETLNECLEKLSKKERSVLIYRFGLKSGEPETLEQVGQRLNLTRERIRQIQEGALKKLRFKLNKYEG